MKFGVLILILCFLIPNVAFNQSVISRVSAGVSYFYYPLINNATAIQSVINQSEAGDTIYLPGTTFNLNASISVDRKLVIIGAGIHPDSTSATGITNLNLGNWIFYFLENSDYSELHGIKMRNNGVRIAQFSNVIGLKFIRCEIDNMLLDENANSILVQECIVNQTIDVEEAQNVTIRNSVIGAIADGNSSTLVENSLILNFNQSFTNNNEGVLYRNNIFTRNISSQIIVAEASIFIRNLWIAIPGSPIEITFAASVLDENNNLKTNQISQVFQNATNYLAFEYDADYSVVPGPYKTMATDGKEVGFFGGTALKKGFHPFNPHWQQVELPNASSGGILKNVLIKGSAQND